MAAVLICGFFIIKKITGCIWHLIIGAIVLLIFLWGLNGIGLIDL